MKKLRCLLAAVGLSLASLCAGFSPSSYAWLTYNPGYSFPFQFGWLNGSNYTGGTPEWFNTANNYDTAYCSVCDANGGAYTDYRGWLRTKLDPKIYYVRLEHDSTGVYFKTYHRHYGLGNTTSNWDTSIEGWFVSGNVEKDEIAPTIVAPSATGSAAWQSSPRVVTVGAYDTGKHFELYMALPDWASSGIRCIHSSWWNQSQQAYYYSESTWSGSVSTATQYYTNSWSREGYWVMDALWTWDRAYNMTQSNPGSVYIEARYDATSPVCSVWTNGGSNKTSDVIYLGGSDEGASGGAGSGISVFQVKSGSSWVNIGSSYTVTANGTYTFRAVDAVGRASAEKSINVTSIDNTPPTVSVSWSKQPLKQDTLTITATDNSGTVTGYMITETSTKPSASASGWQTSNVFTNKAIANKVYYAWAKDAAGNVGGAVADVKSLDLFNPAIDRINVG